VIPAPLWLRNNYWKSTSTLPRCLRTFLTLIQQHLLLLIESMTQIYRSHQGTRNQSWTETSGRLIVDPQGDTLFAQTLHKRSQRVPNRSPQRSSFFVNGDECTMIVTEKSPDGKNRTRDGPRIETRVVKNKILSDKRQCQTNRKPGRCSSKHPLVQNLASLVGLRKLSTPITPEHPQAPTTFIRQMIDARLHTFKQPICPHQLMSHKMWALASRNPAILDGIQKADKIGR